MAADLRRLRVLLHPLRFSRTIITRPISAHANASQHPHHRHCPPTRGVYNRFPLDINALQALAAALVANLPSTS
jgi:hypothetical protein